MKKTNKDLFRKNAVYVAKQLLGKMIKYKEGVGMIVETEAYMEDEASHARTQTKRSEIMYNSYAKWYIYIIYGMYNCLNITTNGVKKPGAVLIRAVEPIEGVKLMKKRRKQEKRHNLCSGPGKLCQAFGITRKLNGSELNDQIKLYNYKKIKPKQIGESGRIGIRKATKLDWRFYIKDNKFVS